MNARSPHDGKVAAAATLARPPTWPDDRFDLVWCVRRDAATGPFALVQIPQLLLRGDSARPID